MGDLQGRKIFKVFNQDFIVDERYTVTKELGQGAYGIVWYVQPTSHLRNHVFCIEFHNRKRIKVLMAILADSNDTVPLRIPRPTKV